MPPTDFLEYELAENGIYRLSRTKSPAQTKARRFSPVSDEDGPKELSSPPGSRLRLGWINDCDQSTELVRPFSDAQGCPYQRPKLKPKTSLLKVLEGNRLERCGRGEWRHRCVFAVLGTTDKRDIARIKSSPVLQATTSLHFAEPHHYYLGHRRNRLPHHRYRDLMNIPPPDVNDVENELPSATLSR